MIQEVLLWSTAIVTGIFAAGLVWIVPDFLAKLRAGRAERATAQKLNDDAAALLDQAKDRDK